MIDLHVSSTGERAKLQIGLLESVLLTRYAHALHALSNLGRLE